MRISEAYGAGKFGLSFELFPPKTPAGEQELFRHLDELAALGPSFITCTYGAGGSTRQKTLEIVDQVRRRHRLPVASHLTCVGATRDELRDYLRAAQQLEIDNIVALRGDPPQGQSEFRPRAGGLTYAAEMVELVRHEFPDFGIAVAGYPETHREAKSVEADLENLRRKVEAGGDVVITQLFYSNDDFFRFRRRAEAIGIRVPIVPGILPVTSLCRSERITSLCGATLPADFVAALDCQASDAEGQFQIGVEFAIRQVEGLLAAGIPGIHFYVLNKSPATTAVVRAVQLGEGVRGQRSG